MTKNTLRFVTPIKIGTNLKTDKKQFEPNEKNPGTWTNQMLRDYFKENVPTLDLDAFIPFETGKQLLSITKLDVMANMVKCDTSDPPMDEY